MKIIFETDFRHLKWKHGLILLHAYKNCNHLRPDIVHIPALVGTQQESKFVASQVTRPSQLNFYLIFTELKDKLEIKTRLKYSKLTNNKNKMRKNLFGLV